MKTNKETVNTNWTKATTDLETAIVGLLSARRTNKAAWVEIQRNGEQAFPVMIKNPDLDNPFNWVMSYGVPTPPPKNYGYFNDTEKDLTENYIAAFGTREAIKEYQEKGVLSKDLIKGIGICHPIKKVDFKKLRPDLDANYNLWTTYWKPKKETPYRIPDPSLKDVYVVCTGESVPEKYDLCKLIKTRIQNDPA